MVPLRSFGDELQFELMSSRGIDLESRLGESLKNGSEFFELPHLKNNLVWKAAAAFYASAGIEPAIKIRLTKNIPLGAGLGGGSSNAAATLLALNRLHRYPLTSKKLMKIGSKLGSDVPFFVCGKCSFVSGAGERVRPAPFSPSGWFVIVNPRFSIETKWAYGRFDQLNSLTKQTGNVRKKRFFSGSKTWKAMKEFCENDFKKVIYPAYPILEEADQKLLTLGANTASLSGSGPSLFGVFETESKAKKAAAAFDKRRWLTWITRGA
jgi:4-diphosphocytidyl-2-C-methyl-D-erythritol kinase